MCIRDSIWASLPDLQDAANGVVIDADALNALASLPDGPGRVPPNAVLTPHPGELARLMQTTVADVQSRRLAIAGEAAATGKPVYIFHPEGGSPKFDRFHASLRYAGITRPFHDARQPLENWSYAPLDAARLIADEIERTLQPKGVLVVIEAEHLCMSMRGVRKPGSSTVTSAVRGLFRENVATRTEAMRFIGRD